MNNHEESIQLDAFNENLNGAKILIQGQFPTGKFPPIMELIQNIRIPFKKKILLTKTAFSFSKYLTLQYDAVFQIKDTMDWQLVLTYITYGPKPNLVVAEDILIPDALWNKLNRQTTLINISSAPVQNCRAYDTIFYAPIEELSTNFADFIYKQLQITYKLSYSQKEHREILQEIRVAAAGLVWSKYTERLVSGRLYWYDPISESQGDEVSNKQLAELFRWLSNKFLTMSAD